MAWDSWTCSVRLADPSRRFGADGAVKRATLMGAPKLVPEDDELLDVEPFGELCLMSE